MIINFYLWSLKKNNVSFKKKYVKERTLRIKISNIKKILYTCVGNVDKTFIYMQSYKEYFQLHLRFQFKLYNIIFPWHQNRVENYFNCIQFLI